MTVFAGTRVRRQHRLCRCYYTALHEKQCCVRFSAMPHATCLTHASHSRARARPCLMIVHMPHRLKDFAGHCACPCYSACCKEGAEGHTVRNSCACSAAATCRSCTQPQIQLCAQRSLARTQVSAAPQHVGTHSSAHMDAGYTCMLINVRPSLGISWRCLATNAQARACQARHTCCTSTCCLPLSPIASGAEPQLPEVRARSRTLAVRLVGAVQAAQPVQPLRSVLAELAQTPTSPAGREACCAG